MLSAYLPVPRNVTAKPRILFEHLPLRSAHVAVRWLFLCIRRSRCGFSHLLKQLTAALNEWVKLRPGPLPIVVQLELACSRPKDACLALNKTFTGTRNGTSYLRPVDSIR
jgi:hypothetical protein